MSDETWNDAINEGRLLLAAAAIEVPLTEVKARAVVKAWERLSACINEMQPDQTHLCSEYEGALDDAIIALSKHLNKEVA